MIESLGGSLPTAQQRLVEAWAEDPPVGVAAGLGRLMSHPIHRVSKFQIVGPYTLAVSFADGVEQRIDFRPVLQGVLFGPLQDPATFNAVAIDAEAGTLVWPNGADFDPATLHEWPNVVEELTARAGMWASTEQLANRRMEPTRR